MTSNKFQDDNRNKIMIENKYIITENFSENKISNRDQKSEKNKKQKLID